MSLTCKVNNIEIELKYSDNIEENIISINSKKELFFDVYECVINNEKIILEKVGESDLGPKVLLEVNIDGKKYSAEAVLVDNDSNYVELNKENIYFIRKIPDEDKSPSEIMQDELEPIINEEEKSDNIEVNYENIIEHHVNNKLVFLHELEEQFEEKIVSLKDDISNKLDLFFEKLEDKKKIIIDDKLENISNELNNKFTVLQTELHSVEDFSKKNIDNILEKKINEIDSSVNLFLEGITKEYKNKIISSDKKITHNFLELNSIKDKLKENSNVIDKKFEDLNLLKEKLLEQDELVLKNQELKKFINTEFKNIDSKFKNLSEEENKKYNELLAAVSNKDIVEYKTILKEKIQDVELTNIKEALQEDITNALQGDIVSLKRYVEMSSGGGSTAKQFAAGGTMDGNLDVNGNILSGGVNLTDVFNTDTSINLQDVTNNGNTTTNLISSNNTIIADTILATSILSSTQLDIGFELSGFNVTGDLSASGGLSANNINVSGDILPSETTTFNIGSSALRFKDIFLAGSTIDLSGTKISTDSEGDIEFRDKNNLPKRIKASEIVLESSNDPDNDIVFKVNEGGNPEFEKRRRSNPNIIEPSTTISDIVSAVQVRVRGNVGIGTSPIIPPNKPLTVVGEISATDNISTGSNLQLGGNIVDTDANEIITIADNDITFAGKHIRSGFDVGVRSQRGCVKGIAQSNSSSSKFGIFNCSIEAITVDTVGKVGIGTTSPNNQLTVSGSISSTGLATVSALKINSDGTSSSDQSPFTFEVSADRKNSTTTALYIYPKDSTNHRVFFQNPAQDRNVYAVNFSGLTQIEDTPAFNNLTAKSTNKNGDNFGLGTIAGTGVRRNGTTDDFDLFVSHNSNIPDFVFHSLTGGFFSSDAQLAGTNEIMRLTNEGKLGIGNRTPTHAFDIKDVFSADGTMRARVERTTNGQVSYDLKNTVTEFRQLVDGNAAYKIFDSENSATRFTIDSAGKVGIGTTLPNNELTVSGSISSTGPVTSLSGVFTDSVGIGTETTETKLTVTGSGSNGGLSINNGNGQRVKSYFNDTTSTSDFVFTRVGTGGSEITLQSDGDIILNGAGNNVGIGDTTPSYELDVNGTINAATRYRINSQKLAEFNSNTLSVGSSNADHCLGLMAGASQRVTILSSGNVGIGRTDPSKLLDIKDGDFRISSTEPKIFLNDTNNNSDFSIKNNNGNFQISDTTNGPARLTIDSSGRVLIGHTTSLHTSAGLQLSNSTFARMMLIDSDASNLYAFIDKNHAQLSLTSQYDDSHGTIALRSFNGTTTRTNLFITVAGKVGIGTTSPNEKLTVAGSISSTDTVASLSGHFTDSVGIGTTSPGVALHVVGDLQVDDTDGSPTLTYDSSSNQLNTAGATFEINKSNGVDVAIGNDDFYVDMSTSRVGIGTRTPTEALDIVGTQIIRPITYAGNQDSAAISFAASNNSAWDNLFGIRFATDSSGVPSLRLRANGNDKLTVKQTGVGIGTDSPTEVLTVEGAVSASGGYKIGADAFVTHNTSYTLPLSDNGKTTLLDTTSGSIVITVPNLETGFSNRFIKEAGAAPVVFSVGNGLSALGSYQDRNQMSIIYAQADIFYKNENYAFLGGNLE